MTYTIQDAYESVNLAEFFDDDQLDRLGIEVCEAVDSDEQSRKEWMDSLGDWLKLATQVRESKSYPWDNASNVKYPLMTIACMQFHARALPGLIPDSRPVKGKVIGSDDDGKKARRASRVSQFMSYQVLDQMEEWVDDLDRMLLVLPMIGLAFKKSYYSAPMGRLKSVLLLPDECVLNYHATSYDRARFTHKIPMVSNELIELQRGGIFRDILLGEPQQRENNQLRDETLGFSRGNSRDDPYTILEVHDWWDLDEDGYKEPYIITVDSDSKKVLRIVPRWSTQDDVTYNEKEEIAKIVAENSFTPFKFIPDPNSAVYAIGFGTLLGPTNEAVNTLINQLIDAGTLSNMQGGFLSRGAKLPGGATSFRPGEWKIVNSTGADLKSSIFPLPVREPSGTLFSLLQLLISSGEKISAVSDMMIGESPGQNTPATTSMNVLEQGMKVFNSIFKRIHRALGKEFRLLYKLNYTTLDEKYYQDVLNVEVDMSQFGIQQPTPEQLETIKAKLKEENRLASIEDFSPEGVDILPAADPNMASDSAKLLRANDLMQKLAAGLVLNPMVVTKKVLEASGHEDIDQLMTLPPAEPSIEQKEFDLEVTKEMRETIDSYFDNMLKVAEAESKEEGQQAQIYSNLVKDIMGMIKTKRETQQDATRQADGNQTTGQV